MGLGAGGAGSRRLRLHHGLPGRARLQSRQDHPDPKRPKRGDFGFAQAIIFEYFAYKQELAQSMRFGLSANESQQLQSSMNGYCTEIHSGSRRELNISC